MDDEKKKEFARKLEEEKKKKKPEESFYSSLAKKGYLGDRARITVEADEERAKKGR